MGCACLQILLLFSATATTERDSPEPFIKTLRQGYVLVSIFIQTWDLDLFPLSLSEDLVIFALDKKLEPSFSQLD